MTVLPHQRVQRDRCRGVFVLTANRSDHWGTELYAANWVARPVSGGYRHACAECAGQFLAEIDGRQTRYADHDAGVR
jgi:hypothetical protein